MQANEAPQERMSAAWRLHKRGYEPRRGSVMVKTIDTTTTDRLRRSPLYSDLSPSCARKRACMELTTIRRFQRLSANTQSAGKLLEAVEGVGEDCAAEKGEDDGYLVA